MSTKSKFLLVTCGDKKFIAGKASAKIVIALKDAGAAGLTYTALGQKTKNEKSTLYVLANRLRHAKIVKTSTNGDGERILSLANGKKTHVENVATIAS